MKMNKGRIFIDMDLSPEKGVSWAPYVKALAAGLFVLTLVLTSYNVYAFVTNSALISRLEGYANMLSSKQPSSVNSGGLDPKALRKEVEFINDVIKRKTFSWTGLLTQLEASVPQGVHLIQISPDFPAGKVTITGRARAMKEVLAMVDAMSKSGGFRDVFLLRHSKGKEEDAGGVIFTVSAGYGTSSR